MTLFSADAPIKNRNQDSLGRTAFARSLAQAIIERDEKESLVVGIYGSWGSGKTSTMNILEDELNEFCLKEKKDLVVIQFSAWGSHSLQSIFMLFCDSLREALTKLYKQKKFAKKVVKKVAKYGEAISSLSVETELVGKVLGASTPGESTISELKEEIGSLLKKQKQKLIVIIDDIDRLPDSQIRNVFQFVNNVADFSNVTYVLPIDHAVVASALSNVQGFDGERYMQKIVQVPLSLPDPEDGYLLRLIEEELGYLIDPERDDFDSSRLKQISESFLLPNISTPRDVCRLRNTLRFQMNVLNEELNSLDVLSLSALLAFEPRIYEWIKGARGVLIERGFLEKEEARDKRFQESLRIQGYDDFEISSIKERLRPLFPTLFSGAPSEKELWRERRICHKDIFARYFSSSRASQLPSRVIGEYLYQGDIKSLKLSADEALQDGTFHYCLEEIECRLDDIPEAAKPELAQMLLEKYGCDSTETRRGIFYYSCDQLISHMVKTLFLGFDSSTVKDIIVKVLPNMNAGALAAFSYDLNSEEKAHGRTGSTENPDKQILSLGDLLVVENVYLERLEELLQQEDFIQNDSLVALMHLWSRLDGDRFKKFWQDLICEKPQSVCYLIASVAATWVSSGNEAGFSFPEDLLGQVMSREDYIERLDRLKGTPLLRDVEDEVLVKTIVFYIDGYKDSNRFSRMTTKKARALLSDWRG